MQTTHVRFLAPKDVPYTWHGKSLFEYRKTALRPLSRSLGLNDMGTHNQQLNLIMARLDTLQSPKEIDELAQTQAKEATKKAAKKAATKKKRAKKN